VSFTQMFGGVISIKLKGDCCNYKKKKKKKKKVK
jgi:hypothetical protein